MRWLLLVGILILAGCGYQDEPADLVIHNARIYVGNESFDVEQAMAIKDGKILEVGPERQIMNKYDADETIDNRKRPIYPVFIDQPDPVRAFATYVDQLELRNGDREQVIKILALWKARDEMVEDSIGSLTKGKQADFFITDADLLSIKAEKLTTVRVVSVYNDGKLLE